MKYFFTIILNYKIKNFKFEFNLCFINLFIDQNYSLNFLSLIIINISCNNLIKLHLYFLIIIINLNIFKFLNLLFVLITILFNFSFIILFYLSFNQYLIFLLNHTKIHIIILLFKVIFILTKIYNFYLFINNFLLLSLNFIFIFFNLLYILYFFMFN